MRDIQRLLSDPRRPKPAPIEYAGKWVAWDRERQNVIAHGATLAEVHEAVKLTGYADPYIQNVPRCDVILIPTILCPTIERLPPRNARTQK